MKLTVVPYPDSFRILSDEPCVKITRLCELECGGGCNIAEKNLKAFLSEYFEGEILGTGRERIILSLNKSENAAKDGYTLTTGKDTVEICGNDEAGLFYGVQTLRQLLIQGDFSLPSLKIGDAPAFPSRGFMLDCGRYFFTKQAVMQFLDLMALHKLNEFHWHLSDDQGFRCQLDSQLLLTEIGSYRSHTNFNKIPHQGYYTKADMKEIVEYAHERFIRVIPEIDTPGHAVSMIAAYPFLSCFDRELTVAASWGIKHDVLCVGKESTFEFMFSVFDELTEIFTDGVIHIGGDEVPATRWEICPHCQKRMKDEEIEDVSGLHTYYLERIAKYLQQKGIEVRMWNDSVREKTVDSSVCRQLWNKEMTSDDIAAELRKGRRFIMSSADNCYMDLPYGQVSLKKCYEYELIHSELTKEEADNILGVEGCLWTEFVPDMERAYFAAFPRFGAISETCWTKRENRKYERFLENLDGYYRVLSFHGVTPAKKKKVNPKFLSEKAELLLWKRRRLYTGELHNLLDNYAVKKKHRQNNSVGKI